MLVHLCFKEALRRWKAWLVPACSVLAMRGHADWLGDELSFTYEA